MNSCREMIQACEVFDRQAGTYQCFDFEHDTLMYTDGLDQNDYSPEDRQELESLGWFWGEYDCWMHF